jgi:hypothetical protein
MAHDSDPPPGDDRVKVTATFPPRSKFTWPVLMLVVGGAGAGGGTFAYHRASPDGPSTEKVDAAVRRVNKLEETVHQLELSSERTSTKLDDIKDDLREIKDSLNDLRSRRGR